MRGWELLPPLRGSEKQIRWAEDIRQRILQWHIDDILWCGRNWCNQHFDSAHKYWPGATLGEQNLLLALNYLFAENIPEPEELRERKFIRGLRKILSNTEARWWINHRDDALDRKWVRRIGRD